MDEMFCCESCGSTAVSYPRELHGLSRVACAACGSRIGTLGELRARAERSVGRPRRRPAPARPNLLSRL